MQGGLGSQWGQNSREILCKHVCKEFSVHFDSISNTPGRPIRQFSNDFGPILGPKTLQTRLQIFSREFWSHCDSLGSKIDRKSFEDCGFGRPGGANGANGGQGLEITTPLANNHAVRSAFKNFASGSRLLSSVLL